MNIKDPTYLFSENYSWHETYCGFWRFDCSTELSIAEYARNPYSKQDRARLWGWVGSRFQSFHSGLRKILDELDDLHDHKAVLYALISYNKRKYDTRDDQQFEQLRNRIIADYMAVVFSGELP